MWKFGTGVDLRSGLPESYQVVGGCIIHHTHKLQKPHGSDYVTCNGFSVLNINEVGS